MPERLNRVLIDVDGAALELPWPSRDWLLGELTLRDEQAIVDEFEKVGAMSPVRLTAEQKAKLLEVIDHAAEEMSVIDDDGKPITGDAALSQYEGIPELQAELR